MSNEARVQSSLVVRKQASNGTVQIDYASRPGSFVASVTGTYGPVNALNSNVSVSGTDLSFSGVTPGGLAVLTNQDDTNYVTLGVYEPDTDFFYPFMELLPGECYCFRFARFVNRELTGTGTLVGYNASIRAMANTASVRLKVEVFPP